MKRLPPIYGLFGVLAGLLFISFSSNPPNGFTGAPLSGATCSSCHGGGTGTGNVVIVGLPSSITANTTYPITVMVNRTNAVPMRGGFQMVALDASNLNAGTFSNPGLSSTTQTESGRTYFEHNPAKFFGGGNTLTYTVDWTASASGPTTVTMYAAANLANGNGNTSGDAIVTTTASGTLTGGGGAITVNMSSANVSCFGGNNGSATASPSGGGGGPYTFAWSNAGNSATISNLTAGTYTVTVTNGPGGNGTGSVTISQPPFLSVSVVNQTNITCFNPTGSATVQGAGGTGGYSYNWSNGATGATAALPVGSHTVSVTDANNCMATRTVTITSNTTPPAAEAGPAIQLTCTNPARALNGVGSSTGKNISYQWTTANGQIISGGNTLMPIVGQAGTYTLTVTNTTNGCTAADNTTVTNNTTPPTSDAGADMTLSCSTSSLQLNGGNSSTGANFSYLWTTANGNILNGATTLTPTVNAVGTYCLKVTNTTNGCTATDCTSVNATTAPPVADAGSNALLTCGSTSVTLNGSASSSGANFSYLWTTTDGNILNGATTTMPLVNAAGTYTLTVTNTDNGCTASASTSVSSNTTPPIASAGPAMAFNCNNNTVALDGSGSSQGANFTYLWTGPGIQSGANTVNPTVNATGAYAILVTNTSNGCTATANTQVSQTPALSAAIVSQTNVACNGSNGGNATATGSGGNGNYSFAWSNGAASAQAANLVAAIYTVTVTDQDNCTATAIATITEPPALNVNAAASSETGVGANDGTAAANPSGGTPAYSYAWNNGATTQVISNLAPGSYSVTVTDQHACTSAQTVAVNSFSCPNISLMFVRVNTSCNGSADGSATVTPTSGDPPFTFLWSNGNTGAAIGGLAAGTYSTTVTDDKGCVANGNVTVTAPSPLVIAVAQQTNATCHGASTGAATVSASGGTPGYLFFWPNGNTGASQADLAAGNHTVTATDANGCAATTVIQITQPSALTGSIAASGETGNHTNDGSAAASVSGGVPGYIYLWNNGAAAPGITGLSPGEYCVTVTDANGCTLTTCATVNPFVCGAATASVSGQNVSCFAGNDGGAVASSAGLAEPFAYQWSNGGTGANIGDLTAGVYSVTISDAHGCSAIGQTTISQPNELSVSLTHKTDNGCPGISEGTATVEASGGTPGFVFSWSNGDNGPMTNHLAAGTYEVTVSDAHNCTATTPIDILVLPDTEPPIAVTQHISVALDANGMASITPDMVDGGSTDNCGVDTMFIDIFQFGCNDIGVNKVILAIVDAANNCDFDSAFVTIVDEIPPVISCPPNIEVAGGCGAVVTYPLPIATDNCPGVGLALSSGLPTGSVFPEGISEVTWVADDHHGNTSSCTFTVQVNGSFGTTASFTPPSCHGFNDGSATAAPVNGSPPFNYEWNDTGHQTTATASGLPAGSYTVTVTDNTGCVSSAMVEIPEPAPIVITVNQVTPETGQDMNGSISVTVSGGSGQLFTEWFLDGTLVGESENLTELVAGAYVLHVSDNSGCIVSDTILLDNVTATVSPSLESQISIYPNPVSGNLYLQIDLSHPAEVKVELFDLSGKLVLPSQKETIIQKTFLFDLAEKAFGVYTFRIVVNNTVLVKRVVVGR